MNIPFLFAFSRNTSWKTPSFQVIKSVSLFLKAAQPSTTCVYAVQPTIWEAWTAGVPTAPESCPVLHHVTAPSLAHSPRGLSGRRAPALCTYRQRSSEWACMYTPPDFWRCALGVNAHAALLIQMEAQTQILTAAPSARLTYFAFPTMWISLVTKKNEQHV